MSKGTKKEIEPANQPAIKKDQAAAGPGTVPGEGGGNPTEPSAELPFRKKRAAEVFATHTVDELYFTTDDQCFVNQQFAVLHAQGLGDQTVTPINRKEIE
ncbi:MAG: hypothetical protein PHQ65_07735 [Bacteroidales bacterium]|nr:hypothetical protein [Bacteroidales bacterium]MDD3665140.1 hypothetical protein [Bacteroidales bacterium]